MPGDRAVRASFAGIGPFDHSREIGAAMTDEQAEARISDLEGAVTALEQEVEKIREDLRALAAVVGERLHDAIG